MVEAGNLKAVFTGFAGGAQMDGKTFAKVAKDCKLLDKGLTATDIDLIFAKVKDKAERKISYAQFENALKLCAEKKKNSVDDVKAAVMAAGGPKFAGTKADAVKFHDDKSLYSGIHANGGPSTIDSVHPVASFGGAPAAEEAKLAGAAKAKQGVSTASAAGFLQEVFQNFATGSEMDGKTFAKVAKDTKILDKGLTATDIDLIFAKVKDKAARKINYTQFAKGVEEMATKKKITFDALSAKLMEKGGPVFAGTKAEAVKYHDDKSMYTGVHGKGGPSTIDTDKISDISQTCDRSGADVRGVKHK